MATVLDMSMSLDGFIAGPNEGPHNPLGDGGLRLHVVPVLFGQGRRLLDQLDAEHLDLERVRILVGEHDVTHLHYRVRRPQGER